MTKCDHKKWDTELWFHGKITASLKRQRTGGRPKVFMIEQSHYKTVTIICNHCQINWTIPYSRSPKWIKTIMDGLNKKSPISEGLKKNIK